MCEEDLGMQHFCDVFVFGELGSVVCGDGENMPFEPRSLTTEKSKTLTIQRGLDIKAGRTKLIGHETVMQKIEQMLATYAD